jgi:hypothetical protein
MILWVCRSTGSETATSAGRSESIHCAQGSSNPQQAPGRYRGDMIANPEGSRVTWDRYIGHNIARLSVDGNGNGQNIDFDFNQNDFFRSNAEHAESRMVRRLFGLTNIFDTWTTVNPIGDKSRAASLNEVTLYTSLESCARARA